MSLANTQLLRWTRSELDTASESQHALTAEKLAARLEALVQEYSGTLYRVAFSILRNASDAEDVVQEAFIRVMRHSNKLEELRETRIWLVRIAWNLSIDRKRQNKALGYPVSLEEEAMEMDRHTRPSTRLASTDLPADKALIAAEQNTRLLRMMDLLPRKEREVLLLSALEELQIPEIAAVLKITESAVRSRLYRARQILRKRLASGKGGAQ
ncbi:MAG: RNA polymerase sigma factor [Acidobacteriaceae bacterium]